MNVLTLAKLFLVVVMMLTDRTSAVNDDRLSYCLDGHNHKKAPGPEDKLHKQCTPWKERSCCTSNTTTHAHSGTMYGFDYEHCPGRKMSAKCKEHFIQDLCFYECSPNIGPWVQKVQGMKFRRERFFEAPLCASDCNEWFDACKEDYTCTDNWSRNFEWKNGKNSCPANSQCRTFQEVYVDAKNFCERVWDGSWKYTGDDQHCMRIWFDGSQGNPNDAVARWEQLSRNAISSSTKTSAATLHLTLTSFFGLVGVYSY